VSGLAVDLNLPTLVATVARSLGFADAAVARLRSVLDRKDEAGVGPLAGAHADLFIALLQAFGPAEQALRRLDAIALPEPARAELTELDAAVRLIRRRAPTLALTLDAVEHRGFEYQSGISFIFFAAGARRELGRGGRYRTEAGEGATGFTLYTDTLLGALPRPQAARRVLVNAEAGREAAQLRERGWVTVASLGEIADPDAEALRLGCSHVLIGGEPRPVTGPHKQR
jgi:ATP phosphoribosyltransferase regulatory subunit